MGIAAYNRGSAAIARSILGDKDSFSESERIIVERVNSQPAGDVRLYTDTVVARLNPQGRGFVLMNQQEKGWASYGVPFKTLDEIRRTYAVRLVWYDVDEHSSYWLWRSEG